MSQIYFIGVTLHVSDGLSVHHQDFKAVHTATGICQTDTADCLLAIWQKYLFDICLLLYVQSWTPDDGRQNRPKQVECYFKIKWNKFDTLVHLVGFTIELFYDARPYERHTIMNIRVPSKTKKCFATSNGSFTGRAVPCGVRGQLQVRCTKETKLIIYWNEPSLHNIQITVVNLQLVN